MVQYTFNYRYKSPVGMPITLNPNENLYLVFYPHAYQNDDHPAPANMYENFGANFLMGFFSDTESFRLQGGYDDNNHENFDITVSPPDGAMSKSFIKLSMSTEVAATPAKVYMINEAFSRVAESLTGDKLRVYSDYFGRTDASPYVSGTDGHGSLECITSGLLIRGQEQTSGGNPPITVSFKDLYEAMDALHCIGMSLEHDGANPNSSQRLRIEPVSHFYETDPIMICDNVDEVTIENNADRVYATFNSGYLKWEGEKTQGLLEFLTKRTYRTTLSTAKAVLDKACKFIASGYAIETTRRQLGQNTQDWRFDNDGFIICLKRAASSPPFAVEQGSIANNAFISHADKLYNYRISPIRNAMRWLGQIFQSYRNWTLGKLFYTNGAGNLVASGKYTPTYDAHTITPEDKPIAENWDLHYGLFAHPNAHYPIFTNQTVRFTYPLSYGQFKNIQHKPYGLIGFSTNGGNVQYGWIEDLKYSPFNGTAEFVLKLQAQP